MIAVVTGTGRGLGRALACRFWADGYKVIGNRLSRAEEDQCVGMSVYGDIREKGVRQSICNKINEQGLDILVNNVAIYECKPLIDFTLEEIEQIIDVDLTSHIFLTKMLWTELMKRKGIVVNINSLTRLASKKGESIYATAKLGLAGFSQALQFDGTTDGVRVMTVYVGAMKTDMTKNRKDWSKFIDPDEVADIIVDLCHNKNSLRVTEITLMRKNY